jgi:tRNA 5-methylaminomethyl-2-thiouridine biosynthesis bifunctional protein
MTRESAPSALEWNDLGQPRSRLYGDIYFSAEDGLAEARAVFLQGCGLPEGWTGRPRFTVGELGFGCGLNILALLDLWRRDLPAGGHLHIFSVEAHPLSQAEAARALAPWPELTPLAEPLLARWPGHARGVHRVEFPGLAATLDVAVGEVGDALADWSGGADAWFLDGFSPALNPAMWRDEVLTLVAQRSAPGARAATYTIAGQVRRGLASGGFEVTRKPGFGHKRERLEATLPGAARAAATTRRVAVIGAGIAGAAAGRAVRALGGEAIMVEALAPGAGGSGNPAALVTPRLDAGLGPSARLFAEAFRRAIRLYEDIPGAILARGVLQLAMAPRDHGRFEAIAASDLFEPEAMAVLSRAAAAARLGEVSPEALDQTDALLVDPGPILDAWAGPVIKAQAVKVVRTGEAWVLTDAAGGEIIRADAVILAAGLATTALADTPPLTAVRGQLSWAPDAPARLRPCAWSGYAASGPMGLMFGATHDRDDRGLEVRHDDHRRNLATLSERLPGLAASLAGLPLRGRASLRATTRDNLPLAGAAPGGADGLHLLAGFGGRGFSLAPLLAEHVAALALGAPSPLAASLSALVDPARFRRRAERSHSAGPAVGL